MLGTPVTTRPRAPTSRLQRVFSLAKLAVVAALLTILVSQRPRAKSTSAASSRPIAAAPANAALVSSSQAAEAAEEGETVEAIPRPPWSAAAVGSGSWGNTVAMLVAENTANRRDWVSEVKMQIYDEIVLTEEDMYGLQQIGNQSAGNKGVVTLPQGGFGTKLSHIINNQNENVKYLPGIALPKNLHAEPDMEATVSGADVVVMGVPDQFIKATAQKMKPFLKKSVRIIMLAKGMEYEHGTMLPVTDVVAQELGLPVSQVCCLMGANIAKDVALQHFSESTLGCKEADDLKWLQPIFSRPYFPVATVQNVEGPQMCGALKNVVAIGKGLLDGLSASTNTIAALMRIGMKEMKGFIKEFFDVPDYVFWESCCVADLITTCMSGRNQRVAAEYVRRGGRDSFEALEHELLDGQRLQGTITAIPVHQVLKQRGWLKKYPLLEGVYQVVKNRANPSSILEVLEKVPQRDSSS